MDFHTPIPAPGTPTTDDAEQRRALANGRRNAMLLRIRRIRRSVAAATVAVFTAAFLMVYVQLASGHDPALSTAAGRGTSASSGKTVSGTAQSTGESSTAASESSSAGSESSSSSSSGSGAGESSGESSSPATVTTKQS